MAYESLSEARAARDAAENGSLTEAEFEELLGHLQSDPSEYTATVMSALAGALESTPTRLETARPIVMAILRGTQSNTGTTLPTSIHQLALQTSVAFMQEPSLIDEQATALATKLIDADPLAGNIAGLILANGILNSDTSTELELETRAERVLTITQETLELIDYDELPPNLGHCLVSIKLLADRIDEPWFVEATVETVDVLLLLGYSEAPIRQHALNAISQMAKTAPEPLELFVTPLVTRLNPPGGTASAEATLPTAGPDVQASRAVRVGSALRALSYLAPAFPAQAALGVADGRALLVDDSDRIRLRAVQYLLKLHAVGAEDLSGDAAKLQTAIDETRKEGPWAGVIINSCAAVIEHGSVADIRFVDPLIETFLKHHTPGDDDLSGDDKLLAELGSAALLAEQIPTPAVVEYLTKRDFDEEATQLGAELTLIRGLLSSPACAQLLTNNRGYVYDLVIEHGEEVIDEGDYEVAAMEQLLGNLSKADSLEPEASNLLETLKQ